MQGSNNRDEIERVKQENAELREELSQAWGTIGAMEKRLTALEKAKKGGQGQKGGKKE